jgi:hypothetical protein
MFALLHSIGRARAAMPPEPLRKIVEQFAGPRARLLVTGGDSAARPTVEVAHEALIRTWPRLRIWIDANREKLRARAAILQGKAEWEQHGRREDLLLPAGFRLERARSLLSDPGDVPAASPPPPASCAHHCGGTAVAGAGQACAGGFASMSLLGNTLVLALTRRRRLARQPLSGLGSDFEARRVVGVAFEMARVALGLGDHTDLANEMIAKRMIELAKVGERNPDLLCEGVLKEFRERRL